PGASPAAPATRFRRGVWRWRYSTAPSSATPPADRHRQRPAGPAGPAAPTAPPPPQPAGAPVARSSAAAAAAPAPAPAAPPPAPPRARLRVPRAAPLPAGP